MPAGANSANTDVDVRQQQRLMNSFFQHNNISTPSHADGRSDLYLYAILACTVTKHNAVQRLSNCNPTDFKLERNTVFPLKI